jgi:glycosyltransferase involved in cell wall biosynthesis
VHILVVSNLYPPLVRGGYEVECATVVGHLSTEHDVQVLTGHQARPRIAPQPHVARELALLAPSPRGSLRAPFASVDAVRIARRALAQGPDLIYVWNGASIPQAALRILADSGVPLAFRVCEHWFASLFTSDQYLRELLPSPRGPGRAAWALGCRAVNRLPTMHLDPTAPLRAAISWNAHTVQRMVGHPPFVEPVMERVCYSVPPHGELYASVVRTPAPSPEILFVGRVTPYKGLSVAIEALAALRDEHGVEAVLEIVGPEDAGHGVELRRLAQQLGVADALRWRGQLDPEAIAAALARAHALIVPSVWDEPFPLVTIEGALAAVPLVASDVGGISEGMHHDEHALLFARHDSRAAAAALARTLGEPEQTAARVVRARARAEAFRLASYLEQQSIFVVDALAALQGHRSA